MPNIRQPRQVGVLALGLAVVLFAAAACLLDRAAWPLVRNTLTLAVRSALIATPVGALLAFLLTRVATPAPTAAWVVVGTLLFIPLQLQLAGWDALCGKLGWQTLAYGSAAEPFLHGMRGAIWVHAMAAIPWVTLLCSFGWLAIEAQWEEAALLEMPAWRVIWRVTLPQALPFIAAAALWVMIQTAGEMTATNIYVVRTYAEELYNSLAADGAGESLGQLILPGALGTAAVVLAGLAVMSPLASTMQIVGRRASIRFGSPRAAILAGLLLWSLLAVLVAAPAVSLVIRAGMIVQPTPHGSVRVWSALAALQVIGLTPLRFADEFRWTLLIAATTATAATLAAIYPAWRARAGSPALAWGLLAGTLALPGPMVGLAVIWLLNRAEIPGFVFLYDRTIAAPVLAMFVRALPLAILVLTLGLASLGRERMEAAAVDGAGPLTQFWRVALPQRLPTLAAAWLLAFVLAAGDLACSILVLPPGITTLQFRLFEKVHSGVEEQVAGIALVSAAAYGLLMLAAVGLFRLAAKRR